MTSPRADEYLLTLARSLEAGGETRRALAVLDLAASRETGAADALALKGDLLRSRGELRQAADVFHLLDRRHPDHPRARYLSALLSGTPAPLPASRPAPWPSAFVRIENFLGGPRHDELLDFVTSGTTYEPSTVGGMGANGPRVDLGVRASFRIPGIGSVAEWLRPLLEDCLRSMSAPLGIAPFEAAMMELKCTAYGDGNFFRVHSDSQHHPTRRISFIYYLHRLPKRYSGGALLLFDGDAASRTRFFLDSFTRLETIDNSVVFFPSGTYHEVTPVVSPSGLMADARFTFAGHVHAADDAAAPVGHGFSGE